MQAAVSATTRLRVREKAEKLVDGMRSVGL